MAVDGVFVGEADVNGNGRYIVDARTVLTVGDHDISSVLIDGDGEALLRVLVPFNRPAGDRLAAVASDSAVLADMEEGKVENASTSKSVGLDVRSLETVSDDMGKAHNADAVVDRVLADAIDERKPVSLADDGNSSVEGPLASLSSGVSVDSGNIESKNPAWARSSHDDGGKEGGGLATLQQAALTPAATSVIIRRGDTLWRISRRTYGQGVRYTTIYLANRQQIADPDLIEPGQIFEVPDIPMSSSKALEIHQGLLDGGKSLKID